MEVPLMRLRRLAVPLALLLWGVTAFDVGDLRALAQGRGRGVAAPEVPRGLRVSTGEAMAGYLLFAPLNSDTTFLIDGDGRVVRTWTSDLAPGAAVTMLDDGRVVRAGFEPETQGFSGGGQGGRLQEFSFDGDLTWNFSLNDATRLLHHDFTVLPNGNVLAIAWELKRAEEARQVGRRPGFIPQGGVWPDMVVELEPQRPNGARVVWEWHAWDHLIQHIDPDLPNYADPSSRPERIDINGDILGVTTPPPNPTSDIMHVNSVAYNATLDQIILSVPRFNEVWVIDHSTTTGEARGSTGGRSGRGGDLLYRWGNPQVYGFGTDADRFLGFQHDAHWVPPGFPGAGHIMVFSNRGRGPGRGGPTTVYEVAPPVDGRGRYSRPPNGPFGPATPTWSYAAPDFQAPYISGATRLANGHTLVSSGPQGRVFEVTPDGRIVWEYWSPYSGSLGGPQGVANPHALFRAVRIPADHPAVAGRTLRPLDPQPPLRSPE
jgi:hypothetical protein